MSFKKRYAYLIVGLTCCLLLYKGWDYRFSGNNIYLKASDLETTSVEQGDLRRKINAYGVFQSKEQRLITASTYSIVDEITLKPGDKVKPSSALMRLENLKLKSQLSEQKSEVTSAKNRLREVELTQDVDILKQESSVADIKAKLEIAELRGNAYSSLSTSGVVSKIDAKIAELNAAQLKKRLDMEKRRLSILNEVHREQRELQLDRINLAEQQFKNLKQQIADLTVKSQLSGVIQQIYVELGQGVTPGDALALVGSTSDLHVELKVPQLNAEFIKEGDRVNLNARSATVEGTVNRVDPVVEEGSVNVYVDVPEDLPSSIRPMQVVDGVIFGEKVKGINFIKRPEYVQPNTSSEVFKLINKALARRVIVQFGSVVNDEIEIISGLELGDQVLKYHPKVPDSVNTIKIVGTKNEQ